MRFIFYSLKYLSLRKERNSFLLWRDTAPTLTIVALISVPFIFLENSNYFGAQGFLERIATLASALTGFFVAALVAVATFSDKIGDLDTPIEMGKILSKDSYGDLQILSRREYVCYMFGYLSFLCLFLSIISILTLVIYSPINQIYHEFIKSASIEIYYIPQIASTFVMIIFNLVVGHIIVTTCHSLYYMINRIYTKRPVMMPKPPNPGHSDKRPDHSQSDVDS